MNDRFASMLTRWTAALAVLALLAAGSPVEAKKRRDKELRGDDQEAARATEAQKHFNFGYQYYQQGLLKQAMESLRRALDIEPAHAHARYVLGMVLVELNDYERAKQELLRVLELNPMFTEAHNVLGMVHARQGNYEAALREFEAVKADIDFPTPEVAHFNIGKVFSETDACSDALIHLQRAIEINPKFGKAWFLLGDCQERLGLLTDARGSLEQAVALLPEDPDVHYRMGYACFLLRDTACARVHFDKVRLLAPSSPLAEGAREFIRQIDFR